MSSNIPDYLNNRVAKQLKVPFEDECYHRSCLTQALRKIRRLKMLKRYFKVFRIRE